MGKNNQPKEKPNINPNHKNKRSNKVHSDYAITKWFLLVLVLVVAAIIAIHLNNESEIVTAKKLEYTIDVDGSDEKINWKNYPTREIELIEPLYISESGTYRLSGNLEDGQVRIKNSDGQVRLILEDVNIKNNDGPAIFCEAADHLVIELSGKSALEDGETYSTDYESDITGAIYSKSDLIFQGDGELMIKANYLDGIVSKDDLKFTNGTYNIEAKDDAIRGKDSIYIKNGTFIIDSIADAIKSTNENNTGKGFILIEQGNFNIKTNAKAIKSYNTILIHGGEFSLNTYDDAIHSDNYLGITGGNLNINSGDDGIHANRKIIIDGGNIIIARALEGIEAKSITINDGMIRLKTVNDGINASVESKTTFEGDPRTKTFNENENCNLTINGGDIYVDADGDGIDSNGWIYFNGGSVVIDGPTNDKNGALDASTGIIMNGGTVLAIGSSGMANSLGNTSSVINTSIYLDNTLPAGTLIEIKDKSGETLFSHEPSKSFNHITAGSPMFTLGEDYTIYINQEAKRHFKITDITTLVKNR